MMRTALVRLDNTQFCHRIACWMKETLRMAGIDTDLEHIAIGPHLHLQLEEDDYLLVK